MVEKDTPNRFVEQYYEQVSESIKLIFDLTSRIDERMKMVIERLNEHDDRFDRHSDQHTQTNSKIAILEAKDFASLKAEINSLTSKIIALESLGLKRDLEQVEDELQETQEQVNDLVKRIDGSESKWNKLLDAAFKLGFIVLAAYLLYKFGLQAPL